MISGKKKSGRPSSDFDVRVSLTAVVTNNRVDGRSVAAAAGGISELFRVALAAQAIVDAATPEHQDLFERRPEVAVEPGVNDRVQEAVGVAEPQQKAAERVRDARLRVVAPRFHQGKQEERKPTGGMVPL